MKQKFTIEIIAEVSRHDFYPDVALYGCRRCAFFDICYAVQNMLEQFPYSLVKLSDLPCHQNVGKTERKYLKFNSK